MKVKNIVFSGFMAAILGATGANAAINVASQGYVDSKVGAVETNITDNYLTKTDAQNTYLTESQVQQEIKDVVGDSTSGVVADVAANKIAIAGLESSKADKTQVATDIANAVAGKADTANVYSKTDADSTFATKTALGDVDAKFEEYTKTSELDSTFATDEELKAVDDKFADYTTTGDLTTTLNSYATTEALNGVKATAEAAATQTYVDTEFAKYTTTEALNTKLNDYAKTTALKAEEDARKAADEATAEALEGYTKTADLDAGFVTENEMTTFKSENNTAIADAKKAGTDANAALEAYKTTNNAAVEAAKNQADKGVADAATAKAAADKAQGEVDTLEGKVSTLETELATKIDAPAACEKQDCVLSINKASGTITWVPLTEPVSEFLNK